MLCQSGSKLFGGQSQLFRILSLQKNHKIGLASDLIDDFPIESGIFLREKGTDIAFETEFRALVRRNRRKQGENGDDPISMFPRDAGDPIENHGRYSSNFAPSGGIMVKISSGIVSSWVIFRSRSRSDFPF